MKVYKITKTELLKINLVVEVSYSDKHEDENGKYEAYFLYLNKEDEEPDVIIRKYSNGDYAVYDYLNNTGDMFFFPKHAYQFAEHMIQSIAKSRKVA